jgi:poly(A) polymerase
LQQTGIPHLLHTYSALDRYFRVREPGNVFVLARTSLVDLARVFEDLDYGASALSDASVVHDGTRYLLKCDEDDERRHPFTVMDLRYDVDRDVYLDPRDVYPDLRRETLRHVEHATSPHQALMDAARIVSRYHYRLEAEMLDPVDHFPPLRAADQRDLLTAILSGRHSQEGLGLLATAGFISEYWPELEQMVGISHAKDFHPEGDVWQHTLEALRHRKTASLRLSLALLFHDSGKAVASPAGQNRFDKHSELGERIARRFLARLGYAENLIEDVCFLVRYHMIPPALKRLPEHRTAPLMSSPLFPELLELYYADLSSSYHSPEGYYEACRIYRRFVRRRRSPTPAPRRKGRQRSHFR